MNRKAGNIISGIFFGVFIAPIVSILWFATPWLRNFPVGDDSPHGVGLPTGFCIGVAIALTLNRRYRWGRVGVIVGAVLLVIAIGCSVITYVMADTVQGWQEGIAWLVGFIFSLHGVVSSFGLLLSGLFSALRAKDPINETNSTIK